MRAVVVVVWVAGCAGPAAEPRRPVAEGDAAVVAMDAGVVDAAASAGPTRAFAIREGRNANHFYQSDRFTAHTVVRSGSAPRIIVATPAGNSGVGLWFRGGRGAVQLRVGKTAEVSRSGLGGVEFSVAGPSKLILERVLLDSVRALRDFEHGALPKREKIVRAAVTAMARAEGGEVEQFRERLHAWLAPRWVAGDKGRTWIIERTNVAGIVYRLELTPFRGTAAAISSGHLEISGRRGTHFRLRVLTNRKPMTPLARVLRSKTQTERNLGFLSYREAFLAGSWQYLTYFGRDTMITASLLGRRATPEALTSAVRSVLDRISPRGQVAHEESIGDQAILERLPRFIEKVRAGHITITRAALQSLERPVYDYKMIDGEYILPPLLDLYASSVSPAALRESLGKGRVRALARLTARVLAQTEMLNRARSTKALVHLNPGELTGNWRDSQTGLGGGRIPLDVNAYLAPAALRSLAALLLRPGFPRAQFLAAVDDIRRGSSKQLLPAAIERRARVWDTAHEMFTVKLSSAEARRRLNAYVATLSRAERRTLGRARLWSGATVADALAGKAAAELDGGVEFPAVALDRTGKPIPIMNTDESFGLFYGQPSRERVRSAVTRVFQPYPVGLATPVGLVVANPAYSDRQSDAATFGRDKYHGAVIWSWPQTMMRQGLERQLRRFKKDPQTRRVLRRALRVMDAADRRVGKLRASELWTWDAAGGRVRAVPFGQSAGHSDESNAIQLWSNTR